MSSSERPAQAQPSFAERLAAEAPALRAFLRRAAGESLARQHVDDLAQETLARAIRYGAGFDQARPLGAWLRAVALRVLIDHRRRAERGPQRDIEGIEHASAQVVDSVEQRDELELLLATLTHVEREALVRFHSHGQSIEQIAAALQTPAGTIKSHLHRARRKLAQRGAERRDSR